MTIQAPARHSKDTSSTTPVPIHPSGKIYFMSLLSG
jgi:hypothetical protein